MGLGKKKKQVLYESCILHAFPAVWIETGDAVLGVAVNAWFVPQQTHLNDNYPSLAPDRSNSGDKCFKCLDIFFKLMQTTKAR